MDRNSPQSHRLETPTLHTARLILRPVELADAAAIQLYFPQWDIVKMLNNQVPWPYPSDGALSYLQHVVLPAVHAGSQWHWSLRLKEMPEQLIGLVSLMDTPGDNRGFWLGLPWQRLGLMQEASDAVTEYWFEVLDRPLMQVPKAVDNRGSCKISERQGMRVVAEGFTDYVSGRHPSQVWEITQHAWHTRVRQPDGHGAP